MVVELRYDHDAVPGIGFAESSVRVYALSFPVPVSTVIRLRGFCLAPRLSFEEEIQRDPPEGLQVVDRVITRRNIAYEG